MRQTSVGKSLLIKRAAVALPRVRLGPGVKTSARPSFQPSALLCPLFFCGMWAVRLWLCGSRLGQAVSSFYQMFSTRSSRCADPRGSL